jgi:hypothetical protein
MTTHTIKYIIVVACREAGSGEARWHSALGVMADGAWIGDSPEPYANRAGDYPHESRYEVVPFDGRYSSSGVRGVPRAHVDLVCGVLEHPSVNPHCSGVDDEDNWIDADLPSWAISTAREWLRSRLLADADEIMTLATARAESLRRKAAGLGAVKEHPHGT